MTKVTGPSRNLDPNPRCGRRQFRRILRYLTDISFKKTFDNTSVGGISTSTFPNTRKARAPGFMPETSKYDFFFFVNGHYVEHSAVTISQSGSNFIVEFVEADLGYVLDGQDEVATWGKFAR